MTLPASSTSSSTIFSCNHTTTLSFLWLHTLSSLRSFVLALPSACKTWLPDIHEHTPVLNPGVWSTITSSKRLFSVTPSKYHTIPPTFLMLSCLVLRITYAYANYIILYLFFHSCLICLQDSRAKGFWLLRQSASSSWNGAWHTEGLSEREAEGLVLW